MGKGKTLRTRTIGAKVTEIEYLLVQRLAKAKNIGISEYFRQAIWLDYRDYCTSLISCPQNISEDNNQVVNLNLDEVSNV